MNLNEIHSANKVFGGLVDNLHGGFGLVDNLYMTYEGNMLVSVRDDASRYSYAGATDFDGEPEQEYPLTYNASGSLVSDAGRGIARIDYDQLNNPVRIQFTNGSVTRYIYSAAGEKLRATHLTAVPNISVAIGSTREFLPSEILSADSTDYLLGGSLTMKNGRIDKYLFDEGYCQATKYVRNPRQDNFTFYYYNRDHLGSIRQVTKADRITNGTVVQSMNYYPFGAQFCDGSTASEVQSRKYNGKEFDNMHGLNTYDYGARQYNPVTARWDRVDPLCEKYYSVSPYAYCANNPVMLVDPEGKDVYTISETGIIMRESENDKVDLLVSNDGMNMAMFSLGFIEQFTSDRDDYNGHYGNTTNIDDAVSLFMFAARNTDVEWAISSYYQKDGNLNFLVYTSHSDEGVTFTNGNFEFKNIHAHIHSHPRNTGIDKASGDYSQMYDSKKDKYVSLDSDDLSIINDNYLEYSNYYPNREFYRDYPKFYIYNAKTNNFFRYDHLHPNIPVK